MPMRSEDIYISRALSEGLAKRYRETWLVRCLYFVATKLSKRCFVPE